MSFPRAKIQRFNDVKGCTPSPAEYNVENKESKNGKGFVSQGERFASVKSPAPSETGSVNSVPCFRTPTLVLKKKSAHLTENGTKIKPNKLLLLRSDSKDTEILKEKIVECNNKDETIKELVEQIDALKNDLADLRRQKNEIMVKKQEYEEKLSKLGEEYSTKVETLNKEHEQQLNTVTEKIMFLKEELRKFRSDFELAKKETEVSFFDFNETLYNVTNIQNSTLENINEQITKNDQQLYNKQRELKILQESCLEITKVYQTEIEKLKKCHLEDLIDLENFVRYQLDIDESYVEQKITNKEIIIKNIQDIIENGHDKLLELWSQKLEQEKEKLRAAIHSENLGKQKLIEIETTYEEKLKKQASEHDEILKECQAISEYNIIQCELEKNQLQTKLTEQSSQFDELNKKYNEVLQKYTSAEESFKQLDIKLAELNSTIDNHEKEIIAKDKKINSLLTEKRTFEISLTKYQETITVLTKRLINSDRDVEQLKSELNSHETKLLELESKYNEVKEEFKQAQLANDELEMQNESTIKLARADIKQIEKEMFKKIENLKRNYDEHLLTLKQTLNVTVSDLNDTLAQLHSQQKITNDFQAFITFLQDMEEEISYFKEKCSQFESNIEELNEELQKFKKEAEKNKALTVELKTKTENIEILTQTIADQEDENNTITKKLKQSEDKIVDLTSLCDYYKMKALEHEKDSEEAAEIRKKYIEQSGRYDQLLQQFEELQKHHSANLRKISDQESLIGPFKQQLERYEMERRALLDEKHCIEAEAKEIGLKYAEILGHQNHKQKIKHMIDLKHKNEELNKNNVELELKLKGTQKTIEKLKKENADLKKSIKKAKPSLVEKENVESPSRSLNSSRVESPGPLRDRN